MMKKSVLLGIVALALMSLSAFAGEDKYEGDWPGHWVWDWQDVCTVKVKMVIPWYVHIKNQDDIWLEQIDCDVIGPNKEWPCFRGCRTTDVDCNFNCTLQCGVVSREVIGGTWGCGVTPMDIDAPGGTTTICVYLWNADLVGAAANTEQHVADVRIKVKPRV
jgi:hypothetical protein